MKDRVDGSRGLTQKVVFWPPHTYMPTHICTQRECLFSLSASLVFKLFKQNLQLTPGSAISLQTLPLENLQQGKAAKSPVPHSWWRAGSSSPEVASSPRPHLKVSHNWAQTRLVSDPSPSTYRVFKHPALDRPCGFLLPLLLPPSLGTWGATLELLCPNKSGLLHFQFQFTLQFRLDLAYCVVVGETCYWDTENLLCWCGNPGQVFGYHLISLHYAQSLLGFNS